METYSYAFLLCVLVCEDNKQKCSLGCDVREVFFSFCSDQVAVIGTGLHPDMRQSGGAYRWSLLPPEGVRYLIQNKCSQTQTHLRDPSVCMQVWICVFSPVFCRVDGGKRQVVDCAGVERAAMGISRFTNASQKTDKPELLFIPHRHSLNGAPSCPSFTHFRPTDCAALLTFLVCLSLCSGPSCLVKGWKSTLQQAAEAYTQQSNIWRRVFSPNGKTCVWLQCCSCSKHSLQNI